jgi:alcohol dehydrogenase class IV
MIKPFQLIQPHKIIFGAGKIADIPALVKYYGNDILLVTGKSSFINSKYCEYLLNTFDLTGIRYHLINVSHEPSPELIGQAVIRHRNINVKLVIAIGGGSVIDAGKAISAMLYRTEPVTDYLDGIGQLLHPGNKIPFIAVPTTAGTGSEATKNAVISQVGQNGFKRSLRHDNFVPDIALLDPELTLNCSQSLTAASGMDCFTQLTESYLSEQSFPYTEALALEGLHNLKNYFLRSWKWGQDLEARSGMSYTALLSGICMANNGSGAVHGLTSSIGGFFNIPHSIVSGTLMGITNKVTIRNLRLKNPGHIALFKYATLGKIFCDDNNRSENYYIDSFIDTINDYNEKFGIKRLSDYGISQNDIHKIIANTGCKNHPVILSDEELTEILESGI